MSSKRWTAKVFVNSDVGEIPVEVYASTYHGAEQQIYAKHGNVQQIVNLRENSGGGSGGGSGLDLDQTTGLVILGGGLLAFFTLTPFIMSGLLGAAGTWGAGKATNYSLQEYADTKNPSDNESKKALTILVSAVVLGTIGFGWGSSIQKGFSTNSNTSMIENIRKA